MKMTRAQELVAAKLFKVDEPKWPDNLGGCLDLLYQMREKRHRLQQQLEDNKKEEAMLREHIFQQFKDQKIDGARGKIAACNIIETTKAQITDFNEACIWIAEHDAWDLLYKRISDPAYRERLEHRIRVAGVEPLKITNLSLTKVGKK
jgi:hypothetical protein